MRAVVSVQGQERGEGCGGEGLVPGWLPLEGGLTRLPPPRPGPLPKPRLRPLWSGKVSPGRDAVLRCETPVAHQSLELLAAGEVVASAYGPSEDLVLTYVGPQHAGKYSCRYRSRWPLVSELSDPVELQVAGEVPLGSESWIPPPPHPSPLPSLRPLSGVPAPVHQLVCSVGVGGGKSRCKGPGAARSLVSWSARREAWAGFGGADSSASFLRGLQEVCQGCTQGPPSPTIFVNFV